MIYRFIYQLGLNIIDNYIFFIGIKNIFIKFIHCLFLLKITNKAIYMVFIRQIYFTAIQPLHIIILSGLVVGSIIVNSLLTILTSLGAYDQIGYFLTSLILEEISPLFCTIIIILRSGSAVISELSLMNFYKEINTIKYLNISVFEYLIFPRILSFILSGLSLSIIFSFISIIGGYLIFGYQQSITFENYIDKIVTGIDIKNILICTSKSSIMSLFSILTAVYQGMKDIHSITYIPILGIQGMVRAISFLILIEIAYTLI